MAIEHGRRAGSAARRDRRHPRDGDRPSRARAIGEGTVIGPYATIGPDVTHRPPLPDRRVERRSTAGPRSATTREIFPFASIGLAPQDLKFKGEPTRLVIGHHNVFREFVTIHRGTAGGGGVTTIGDHNLFMAYAHVAHDCHVGSHDDLRQRGDARRPRDGRGLRDDQRLLRRAPVLPRRPARVHRRLHRRDARRAAVREDGRQPRAHLRRELDRPGAARLQRRS